MADVSVGFTYNAGGQIATRVSSNDAYSFTGIASGSAGYTADGLNRYGAAAGATPTYDARGNLTSAGGTRDGYTSGNRLATGGGGHYYADSLERRDYLSPENLLIGHDGPNNAAEMTYAGGYPIARRYVYAPGEGTPLVWYEANWTSLTGSDTNCRRSLSSSRERRESLRAKSSRADLFNGCGIHLPRRQPIVTPNGRSNAVSISRHRATT